MGFLSMDHYDEDLFENIFFQKLQVDFPQLFDEATLKRWMILVPRCGALEKLKFDLQDFENHILLPVDDQPTVFLTVSQKATSVKGNAITTREGFEKKKTVIVLFEETFFNKNNESYRVLCISQPLEGGMDMDDDCSQLTRMSVLEQYTYDDCCQILWGSTGNRNTNSLLTNAVDNFVRTLNRKMFSSLKILVDQVSTLFKKCVNIVLKDRILKKNALSNPEMRNRIFIAVETYLLQHTYHLLFRNVCAFMADRDEKLNKVTRNFVGLQLKQLSVRSRFCQNVPRARTELSNVIRLMSPMKKLNCLKRVLSVLVGEVDGSFPLSLSNGNIGTGNAADGDNVDLSPFGSDDLLSILVFLIMKTEIPNWWSQWAFMKNFSLAMPLLTSEFECYLSNLEAALEYITSGQLRELRIQNDRAEFAPLANSSGTTTPQDKATQDLAQLFQCLANDDKEAVQNILKEPDSPDEPPSGEIRLLCHPLCDCPKCIEKLNSSDAVLHESSVGVQTQNDQGLSALHVASIFGHIDMVDLLLEKGADVNLTNAMGQTALHLAAQRGHQKLIMLFLHHNASINLQDKRKNTALHWASTNGHNDCVKALIYIGLNNKKPVDLNITNDVCETALHLAARWGYESIVGMLLEHGASPCVTNRKNQTPVDVAHNSRIYEMLREAAELEHASLRQTVLAKKNHKMSSLMSRKLSVGWGYSSAPGNAEEKFNRPTSAPVLQAAWASFPSAAAVAKQKPSTGLAERKVEKLLKSIADGDVQMVKYHFGWSDYELDHPEVNEIDVSKITLCHPLCQCSHCRHFQKLTLPSSSGIHVNCENAQGYTPLHVAAVHGHSDLLLLLLRRGAGVQAVTKTHRYTPLHCACKQPNIKIVKYLVDYGADVSAKDDGDNTPLHFCALSGNAPHTWFLLQVGAEVNTVNNQGNTPLHNAIKVDVFSVVQMLISCGAKVTLQNHQMQTPLCFVNSEEMLESIKTAVAQRVQLMQRPRLQDCKNVHRYSLSIRNTSADSSSDLATSERSACSSVKADESSRNQKRFLSLSSVSDSSYSRQQSFEGHCTKDDSFHMTYLEAVRFVNRQKS